MKRKLCLATMSCLPLSTAEQIRAFKEVGFDGFFTEMSEDVPAYRALADELGMMYQSIHAPFDKAKLMWEEDCGTAVEELISCVRACHDSRVPLLILHTYIGFEPSAGPTQVGLDHYGAVIDEAKKLGVKIAFENTEGEEYLAALLSTFTGDNVGYCWDSGHEACYNRSKDLLALYGDRLFGTHLNDNLGITPRENNAIFWHDDLHLLPYDGTVDWDNAAKRLAGLSFDGPLTFELTTQSKPNRHENDKYAAMGAMADLREAYARATRLEEAVRSHQQHTK